MNHVYLGPAYDDATCRQALDDCREPLAYRRMNDVCTEVADLLAAGHPVAWFQGRMEFGPRALGGRSILGCPSVAGIADRINEQIKFRERWRPFCPSVLDRVAPEMIQTEHPAPFMTITFDVADGWKERVPEVVHEEARRESRSSAETKIPVITSSSRRWSGSPVTVLCSIPRSIAAASRWSAHRKMPWICSSVLIWSTWRWKIIW
jgi:hypothetical protein